MIKGLIEIFIERFHSKPDFIIGLSSLSAEFSGVSEQSSGIKEPTITNIQKAYDRFIDAFEKALNKFSDDKAINKFSNNDHVRLSDTTNYKSLRIGNKEDFHIKEQAAFMILLKERKQIIAFGNKMLQAGLTTGSGGNLSCFNRTENLIALTPSGIEYPDLRPEDIVVMDINGKIYDGKSKPSSETGFHLALYEKRKDINAVVHTHSVYATTFACLNREIKAVHYLIGFAGKKVPVAPYATYGSKQLALNITDTIQDYNCILLANHGLISIGQDLLNAFNTAQEIELVARISYQAETIGKPVILSDQEMNKVIKKFANYGPVKK